MWNDQLTKITKLKRQKYTKIKNTLTNVEQSACKQPPGFSRALLVNINLHITTLLDASDDNGYINVTHEFIQLVLYELFDEEEYRL